MTLHEHHIGTLLVGGRTPEMVETHFVERGARRITRDVPAILGALAIRLHDHRHRIPANIGLDPPFQRAVAGVLRLPRLGYRVEVGRVRAVRQVRPGTPRKIDHAVQQEVRTTRPVSGQHGVNRFQPFAGFDRINIVEGVKTTHILSTGRKPGRLPAPSVNYMKRPDRIIASLHRTVRISTSADIFRLCEVSVKRPAENRNV